MPTSAKPRHKRKFHRPEKTVEVCYRGDLVAQIEDLERTLRDLRTNAQTMADRGEARKVAEQIEAVRAEMQAETEVWRLRGRTREEWVKLLGDHAPREDDERDSAVGFNADTFWPALIRACLVEPALEDDEFDELTSEMSSYQFDSLADAAMAVSRRRVDVPFSFASSATLAPDETSKQPSA